MGRAADDKRIVSSLPSGAMAYFAANMGQFAKLDARQSVAFSQSSLIAFLREYGLTEMSLLGPDLSKPNPFLDMPASPLNSPSSDKIDVTNQTLAQLADKMQNLLSADQRSILQNLLRGNVTRSMSQVEGKLRQILSIFSITKEAFAAFLTDKKFLTDIQILLAGNLEQFNTDIEFMDEIQARYRKARDLLKNLSEEGENIARMKNAVLGSITDEYTKAQVEKEFVRYEQRVTDLTAGVAIADTFINMWEVIKGTHYELIAGITRALYFTVPIIGAQQQLINALARQERTRTAINTLDATRNAMILQMNEMMKAAVDKQHAHDMKSITGDNENLSALLIGTILVRQTVESNDAEKVVALQAGRENYRRISERAQKARLESGLDAEAPPQQTQN